MKSAKAKRRWKDRGLSGIVWLSGGISAAILLVIIGYIIISGIPHLSVSFLQGILPMVANTLFIIFISLLLCIPLGIFTAINEYAKPGRMVRTIRFAVDCLAGIPSIIFGLFGMLLFNKFLGFSYSMLSGGLTLTIMILPTMIRTVEEALKSVPQSFREASLALGATKLRTIRKTVLPSCLTGITTGIILAIGRIVGETAALIFTAGTVNGMAFSTSVSDQFGLLESGRTLAVHMYLIAKESVSMDEAYATALVLIVITLVINGAAGLISKRQKKFD